MRMTERELTIKEVLYFILNQKIGYPGVFTTWDAGTAKHVEMELAKRIAKEFNVKYVHENTVVN